MHKAIVLIFLLAGIAFSQTEIMPAARVHVRMVEGRPIKYTSKLSQVVDLNFTMGNGHQPGKAVISAALDRVANYYGPTRGLNDFSVRHITSSQGGSTKGEIPNFTIEDLLASDVIVGNNISSFGDSSMGVAKQSAIQRAIEVEGKGYLGIHGSGDNQARGWAWYTNTLHPLNYGGQGSRTVGPVYKHLDEASHIVLQGILEANVTQAIVPNELDADGAEVLVPNIPTRGMKTQWSRFNRDISRDPAYKDQVTILLKYDARFLGSDALPAQSKRKGGNLYSYLYKVGEGITSYFLAGHENDEILDPKTGFDGGVGDFDRYLAQTLFFQAGYKTEPCDASCNGLPIVDGNWRLTGERNTSIGIVKIIKSDLEFDLVKVAFSSGYSKEFAATLMDMSGRIISQKIGHGKTYQEFNTSRLKPGVYSLSVKIGSAQAKVKRYAIGL